MKKVLPLDYQVHVLKVRVQWVFFKICPHVQAGGLNKNRQARKAKVMFKAQCNMQIAQFVYALNTYFSVTVPVNPVRHHLRMKSGI